MKMDDSQKELVDKWVAEKWKGYIECPVCQHGKWGINSEIFELRSFHGGQLSVGGPVAPLVAITCRNCGYTLQFNAMQIGIVKTPQHQRSAEIDVASPSEKEASDEHK